MVAVDADGAVMTRPWDVQVSIDAVGHDDAQVRVVTSPGSSRPHILVRTGSVLVHCLDGAAVTSAASAWAAGQVRVGDWLPRQPAPRERPPGGFGDAYPAGSVILDGRQRWAISTAGEGLTVAIGCLHVQVRDRVALDTHVCAWAQASALATRVYPGRAVPYAQLVRRAQISSIRRAAGEPQAPPYRPVPGRRPRTRE